MDFYEIDFHNVTVASNPNSGDAISLRYRIGGQETIHVVDGGWNQTGNNVIEHIRTWYGNPTKIDHIVVTHPDKDHCEGLLPIIRNFNIGVIWMFRPWHYAEYLRRFFPDVPSEQKLIQCLKNAYPYLTEIEKLGIDRQIPIVAPIAGRRIGEFTVLSPTIPLYLELVCSSAKVLRHLYGNGLVVGNQDSENDQSVVQGARLNGNSIVLTADAGDRPLRDSISYSGVAGISAPYVNLFQIPHHGSRQNISKATLQSWLGSIPSTSVDSMHGMVRQAIISVSSNDKYHPSKGVIKTVMNLGVTVYTNECNPAVCFKSNSAPQSPYVVCFKSNSAPQRPYVVQCVPTQLPKEQEIS